MAPVDDVGRQIVIDFGRESVSQPVPMSEFGTADHRDPARPMLVREDGGDRLTHAPGDLLHRDRQREVRNRDPKFLGGRRLEEAEAGCPWRGSSSARPRPASRRPCRLKPGKRGRICSWQGKQRDSSAAQPKNCRRAPMSRPNFTTEVSCFPQALCSQWVSEFHNSHRCSHAASWRRRGVRKALDLHSIQV